MRVYAYVDWWLLTVDSYDKIHNVRKDLIAALKTQFPNYGLRYVK